MEYKASWKPLHHGREGYPELLVKFAASDTGYAVTLTDLTNVWEEKLSGAQIARRAEQDCCTITPGDDADQLGILLSKIEAAFGCGEGTTVNLECKHASDDLTAIISAPLPRPLKPFSWHMCLQRASSRELTTVIVSPLMQLAHQQQRDIQVLLEQLHNKDHVISKLLDRMESANIHLDSVFLLPNLRPTKKMSQREQYAKHVPGLTTFQPGSGRANINEYPSSADLLSILERVPGQGIGDSFTTWKEEWWRDINTFSQAHITLKTGPSMDLDGDETEDDDDFQTQELPEHLLQKEASSAPSVSQAANIPTAVQGSEVDEDAETTDEGETFSLPRPPPQAVQTARAVSPENEGQLQNQPRRSRLGALGGARSLKACDGSREQENDSSSSSASHAKPHVAMDHSTASATPPPSDRTPAIKISPVKRRLGAIGGRSGSSRPASQAIRGHSPPVPSFSTQSIEGYDSSAGPSIDHQQLELHDTAVAAGRSRSGKHGEDQSSQVRETSEERANKKREELKMALDARAKAPAKKKRRF